jgi:hypothetical protein
MDINSLVSSLGLKGTLGSDVVFLILFLLLSFVLSVGLGRQKILVAMLGVYASYVAVSFIPKNFVSEQNTRILIFVALVVAFIIFFGRIIRASLSGSGAHYLIKSIIGSAIIIGLVLVIIFSWMGTKELASFVTPATKKYFTEDLYKFLWAIAPLVYLAVVRKKID